MIPSEHDIYIYKSTPSVMWRAASQSLFVINYRATAEILRSDTSTKDWTQLQKDEYNEARYTRCIGVVEKRLFPNREPIDNQLIEF